MASRPRRAAPSSSAASTAARRASCCAALRASVLPIVRCGPFTPAFTPAFARGERRGEAACPRGVASGRGDAAAPGGGGGSSPPISTPELARARASSTSETVNEVASSAAHDDLGSISPGERSG